ncbi:phage antirepressor KilAC domain-containing protein [Bacillus velezensis]|uniref:phage antirepressor KilAC domain-containing protein n=1 Tax=Bacillus velezensis TaxID=492670 RepID=UPI001CD49582|nr:phage antirepressor KilAC domain-containing protein [Bacillus velezensis]MCA1233835.1 phage antirepressor KilAC domain-containing protein [Bacillus velezensis]MCA1311876.1 phage antirepressor KilAC domain-containing protein [Bacillus velezensis]MCA1328042.1 phage antirepressor KilAC domain-containing protein [Bacillus velezensis]
MTIYNADSYTGITGDHESLLGAMLEEKEDKQLQIIDQRELLGHEFKIYGTYEEPLFLAKDVATWIDYSVSNVSKLIEKVDEDEKTTRTLSTNGYKTDAWFLTEDGLYEVLMQSRKPIAKEFKKEVKRILKTIRKTGGYVANADMMVNTYFGELEDHQKTAVKHLFVNVNKLQDKSQALEKKVTEYQPIVDKYRQFLDADGLMKVGTLAKALNIKGLGQNNLFIFLRDKKLLMKDNQPYQTYVNRGYFKVIARTTPVGNKPVTLVTPKGADYIANLINKSK